MQSTIFNAAGESYQVSHIVHVSGVWEISEEKRKPDRTHAFKLVTTAGSAVACYKNEEAARNARAALAAMLATVKPYVYRHSADLIDPRAIVSISKVIRLNSPQGSHTHAVVVTLDTGDTENNKVWLTYKSEDTAGKGRRLLYAVMARAQEEGANAKDGGDSAADTAPVGASQYEQSR